MKNRDGRNIDEALGTLSGEGSQIEVGDTAAAFPGNRALPVVAEGPSYHGQPAIKQPLWIWSIPVYFYVGGVAGGAAALGAAAQIAGGEGMRPLVQRCRWIAAGGTALSAGLLIHDLGRPARFLHMLRVFRPTSPMNVGTWIVSGAGAASGTSVAADMLGMRRVGDVAGIAAGLFGLPLAGYTAVLISTTAVPLWQGARRSLPVLFVAAAAGATGSFFSLLDLPEEEARIPRRLGIAGKMVELLATAAVEREAARTPEVVRPLHEGLAGRLWQAAKWLGAASLLLDLAPGRSRKRRVVSGALGTAGAVALRFAMLEAGKRSSRDPRAVFQQQRDGHGGKESTGRAAPIGPS